MLDAICLEFVRVSGAEDLITGDFRGDDLDDDVTVGKANNETVLWCIVLVLGLGDEPLASIVIGLSSPTTLVFGLVAASEC